MLIAILLCSALTLIVAGLSLLETYRLTMKLADLHDTTHGLKRSTEYLATRTHYGQAGPVK